MSQNKKYVVQHKVAGRIPETETQGWSNRSRHKTLKQAEQAVKANQRKTTFLAFRIDPECIK